MSESIASNVHPVDERVLEATQHVFKTQLGGDTYNIIGQEMGSKMGQVNVGPELVMQHPNKPIHNPGAKMSQDEHKQGAHGKPVVHNAPGKPEVHNKENKNQPQHVVQMKQPVVEMKQPVAVVKTPVKNDDDDEPSLLDLITGFENTGAVEPFSGSTHYDIDFAQEDNAEKNSHKHQVENFNSEVVGSCGSDGGVAVPGFDLGEFASF